MMEGYVGGELNGQVISFGRMKKKRNTSTLQQCNNSSTLQRFKIAVQCNTSATAPFCGQSRRGGGILIACCIYTHPPCHTLLIRLYHNIFSSHDGTG